MSIFAAVYCICYFSPITDITIGVSTFALVSTDGNGMVLTTELQPRSITECALLCNGDCTGFNFDFANNDCKLFQGGFSVVENTGYHIHMKRLDCVASGFTLVESGGNQYCYNISSPMVYADAKDHCHSQNAHLLHIDSLGEYDALQILVDEFNPPIGLGWVGANDFDIEGVWVSERDGTVLDRTVWRFSDYEPNNTDGLEHCGTIQFYNLLINDYVCDDNIPFICEKYVY